MATLSFLPQELIIEILEHLEYWDLRQIRFTCKQFNVLLSPDTGVRKLLQKTFRDTPLSSSRKIQAGVTHEYHPAFEMLSLAHKSSGPMEQRILFHDGVPDGNITARTQLMNTPIKDDNIMSPAVSLVVLHLPKHLGIRDHFPDHPVIVDSTSSRGVTMGGFLEVYLRLFDKYVAHYVSQVSYRAVGHKLANPNSEMRKNGVLHLYMR